MNWRVLHGSLPDLNEILVVVFNVVSGRGFIDGDKVKIVFLGYFLNIVQTNLDNERRFSVR
jgi:hypothetical protein